ncbi:phage antirepressor [Rhodococcus sp. no. 34]
MSIELFSYESTEIRTVDIGGKRWAVALDICQVLDIKDVRTAVERLDEADRVLTPIRSGGQNRNMWVVSEDGATDLVLDSRKPEARRFRRFLTHEVWPAIRNTGTYSTAPALTDDELIHQALSISATRVAALTERVAELEPKAELAENYLTASAGSRLVGEAAKILDMKEKELRMFLLEERMIFVRHAQCGNVLYDFYADFAPHFEARETVVNHTWGSCNHYTLRITPRGIDLIRKRIRDRKAAA